jgi:hypothetical protein
MLLFHERAVGSISVIRTEPISTHVEGATVANITVAAKERGLAIDYHIKGTHDAVRQGVSALIDIVERRLVHALIHIDRQEEQLTLSGNFILIQCINLQAFHAWLGRTDRIDFSDTDRAPASLTSKAQPLPTLL